MHNLAGILIQQGKYADAEKLERQTREIRIRVLGPAHPDTASSTYNLSCIAAHQGRRDEALALLRDAVDHGLAPWADLGIEKDDDLKSLRGDPRFGALVEHAKERAAVQRSR
jgi:hypothetical protein